MTKFQSSLCLYKIQIPHFLNPIEVVVHFHSPAAEGAQTLVLGAQVLNNDTNSGLCWAAMA
jgi:hypothetical protein